ncbi:hypothetical protein ACFLYR_08250, partial [Chloroflexota bacterium]
AGMTGRAMILFSLMGLCGISGTLVSFLALDIAPVSMIAPFLALQPVFILVLSFLFNRKLEVFGKAVIIGITSVVLGAILLV